MAKRSTRPIPADDPGTPGQVLLDPELTRSIDLILSQIGGSRSSYVNNRLKEIVKHEVEVVMRDMGWSRTEAAQK